MKPQRYKVGRANFCRMAESFRERLLTLVPGAEVSIDWSSPAASGDAFVSARGSCQPGLPFGEAVQKAGGVFLNVADVDGEGVLESQRRDIHNVDFVRAKAPSEQPTEYLLNLEEVHLLGLLASWPCTLACLVERRTSEDVSSLWWMLGALEALDYIRVDSDEKDRRPPECEGAVFITPAGLRVLAVEAVRLAVELKDDDGASVHLLDARGGVR